MKKHIFLAPSVLLTLIIAGLTFAQACDPSLSWCPPSSTAPNPSGATIPLNTGSVGQTKTGWLNLGSGQSTTGLQAGDFQASGLGLFFSGLGVVGGNFQLATGNPGTGKVLTSSDDTGIATWTATSSLGLGIPDLSGTGNALVCVDSTGMLYRGSATDCSAGAGGASPGGGGALNE